MGAWGVIWDKIKPWSKYVFEMLIHMEAIYQMLFFTPLPPLTK